MAKFIMGLLTGLVIGVLFSSYFAENDLNSTANRLRAGIMRHVPGAN